MKTLVILVLTLGIVSVIANPVSKQTIRSENKNSLQVETSDSQTKHEEVINTLNKGDQEQRKDTPIENPVTPNIYTDTSKDVDEKVEIIIEEDIVSPIDEGPNQLEDCPPGVLQQEGQQSTDFIRDNLQITTGIVDGPQLPGNFDGDSQYPGFIEEGPQMPGFIAENPQVPGFDSGIPQLAGVNVDIPQLPGIMAAGTQMPGFNKDQLLGFVAESPIVSGFDGGIPPLSDIIEHMPQLPGFIDNSPNLSDDDENDLLVDKDYFKEDMQTIEHEIMETAAGFVPTPLVFRRKNKPRRRFPTRRHFRRNPYRRHQFIYPYRYYAFYRPSSLRYY